MNHIKPLNLSAFAFLVLAGCGATMKAQVSIKKEFISAPLSVVKKAPLSENELKRWSHLDLIKDSIPGMSVDKAYAELLQGKTGKEVMVDKTWVFRKGKDGKLRIIVHKSALPFNPKA